MPTFRDLKSNKRVRDIFVAYLTQKKLNRVYDFAMKKTTPDDAMVFLLRDIKSHEDMEMGFAGRAAKAAARAVNQEIAADTGPKLISDNKRLLTDKRWQKAVKDGKANALKFVDNAISSYEFSESDGYKRYLHASICSDLSRHSVDFEKEFDMDPKALELFAKRQEISDAMWQKALAKHAPKTKKKKSKFSDFKAFIKRKTGHKL